MQERKKAYSEELRKLLDAASLQIHEAQITAARQHGDPAEARRLFSEAARLEEKVVRQLMVEGHEADAYISLVSAASCYQQAERYAEACELFERALARRDLPSGLRPQLEEAMRACAQALSPPPERRERRVATEPVLTH
jgi:tetratricopeptide (TPR) repeat protein